MPVTLPPVEASSSSRFFHGAGANIGARKKSIMVQMKPRDGPNASQRKQLSSIALRTETGMDDAGGLGNDLLAAGDSLGRVRLMRYPASLKGGVPFHEMQQ